MPAAQILPHYSAVTEVATWLAQAIVRDGEGATKFITVQVEAGRDESECKQIAMPSPLAAGQDRVLRFRPQPRAYPRCDRLCRHRRSDVAALRLYLDEVLVAENGGRAASYREEDGQRVMQQSDITIRVVLNRGAAKRGFGPATFPTITSK